MYALRAFSGVLYLAGVFIMVYNLIKTAKSGSFITDVKAEAAPLEKNYTPEKSEHWHRKMFEWRPVRMLVFSLILVAIGGAIEIIPTFLIQSNVPTISTVKPYTSLELNGRDLYIREGCFTCHSQMIRPFRSEVMRYDPNDLEYSKAGEFVYDHPFQWGSKRTGPDLHRIGGKYPDSWHFYHMLDPESMSPGSIMPPYPWLFEQEWDKERLPAKIEAMQTLGVPYEEGYSEKAVRDAEFQAEGISRNLAAEGLKVNPDAEIVALIAYLQRLGTDIKKSSSEK